MADASSRLDLALDRPVAAHIEQVDLAIQFGKLAMGTAADRAAGIVLEHEHRCFLGAVNSPSRASVSAKGDERRVHDRVSLVLSATVSLAAKPDATCTHL